jgi:hypothetical protein
MREVSREASTACTIVVAGDFGDPPLFGGEAPRVLDVL